MLVSENGNCVVKVEQRWQGASKMYFLSCFMSQLLLMNSEVS